MKKNLLLLGFLTSVFAFSQTQYTGNVGINTPTPTANLHVKGTLRFENPSAGDGKILRVYKDGSIKWSQNKNIISGTLGSGVTLTPAINSANPVYLQCYISLPPGAWIIKANFVTASGGSYSAGSGTSTSIYFSDSSTNSAPSSYLLPQSATLISGSHKYPSLYGMVNGGVVVDNTTNSALTFYMWGYMQSYPSTNTTNTINTFGGGWGEDKFYAIPYFK